MKTFLIFVLLSLVTLTTKSQVIQYRIIDFTYFHFPEEITFWSALESNKVVFDTLKNHCNTIYTIDIPNHVFSYVDFKGNMENFKILNVTQTEVALNVEFLIPNVGVYHFLFGENVNGDTSLVARKKETANGMTEGFFTNKVELIK